MKFAIPVLRLDRYQDDYNPTCLGFFEGANGTKLEIGLEQIAARYEKQKSELQQGAIEKQKRLEAEVAHYGNIGADLESQWMRLKHALNDEIPKFVRPFVIALIGVLSLSAEARMLAPAMDLLNIPDLPSQLLAAFGISFATGLAFHFAWESFSDDKFPPAWKLTVRIIAGCLALSMVAWGILRGLQVGFSAALAESPLAQFLGGHPILSSIFYVMITLAIPVIAATASHFSVHELEQWWNWKRLSQRMQNISKAKPQAIKQLESEKEVLTQSLKRLDAQAEEDKAIYARNHERGTANGVVQEQYWTVPLKASLSAVVATIFLGWFAIAISPFFMLVPGAVWISAFFYYRRQWRSPNPSEFYELERVCFAALATDEIQSELPVA
jgi:hypothetical protein